MKNFPNNFDPIFGVAVVKLQFHVAVAVAVTVAVAVAVAVGQTTASRGMAYTYKCQNWFEVFKL